MSEERYETIVGTSVAKYIQARVAQESGSSGILLNCWIEAKNLPEAKKALQSDRDILNAKETQK